MSALAAGDAMLLDGARSAGFDPDRLRRAFGLLETWVADGTLPGAAAIVSRGGVVGGEAYAGLAHRPAGRRADARTVWSLASVTKPFTAAAVMLLVEEGHFTLDEPLHALVPEFLHAPETPFDRKAVTLRHVLGHCSGLPGMSEDNVDLRRAHRPLEDFVRSFSRQALLFAPGTAHLYSNPGIVLAAEAVGRALSGTLRRAVDTPRVGQYHPFVAARILAPLGMRDTAFFPDPEMAERIAWVEQTGQEGTDWEAPNSAYYRSLGIPWGGLFSTPRDLIRWVDLFLPGAAGRQRIGVDPGVTAADTRPRVLSAAGAAAMTRVQWSLPHVAGDTGFSQRDAAAWTPGVPEKAWGIGWEVKGTKRSDRSGDLTSPSTYGHSGATGTMVWADPAADVACVLLTNRTLVSGWPTEVPRQAMFSNAVMAALL